MLTYDEIQIPPKNLVEILLDKILLIPMYKKQYKFKCREKNIHFISELMKYIVNCSNLESDRETRSLEYTTGMTGSWEDWGLPENHDCIVKKIICENY